MENKKNFLAPRYALQQVIIDCVFCKFDWKSNFSTNSKLVFYKNSKEKNKKKIKIIRSNKI